MDFSFTEEQTLLRDTVASYLGDHYDFDARRAAIKSAAGWRPEVWKAFAEELDPDQLVGAIDSRGGRVVIHGWKTPIPVTPEEAARTLEAYVGAFLYTHVDTEGMMTGLNLDAVKSVQAATKRRLIAAGGIRSREEIDTLDKLGIDAVVGMAIYTGAIDISK